MIKSLGTERSSDQGRFSILDPGRNASKGDVYVTTPCYSVFPGVSRGQRSHAYSRTSLIRTSTIWLLGLSDADLF